MFSAMIGGNRLLPVMRALPALILIFVLAIPAIACSTCGCSEICPIAMMETDSTMNGDRRNAPTRTDSIIGNMLLKLAYQRDPELAAMTKRMKISSAATSTVIGLIASATLAQNIVSMAVLNPPPGSQDSYVPGSIGIGLDGGTSTAFDLRAIVNHKLRKQYRSRQVVICKEVNELLYHLEFSKMTCPEAQKQLVALVGEQASHDFVEFWKASHSDKLVAAQAEPASADQSKAQPTLLSREEMMSVPPIR
ncbi:MAG TPA: hypothetical protein V6C81_18555 [Planktothrix sp.]|jgi:hypothetical protein